LRSVALNNLCDWFFWDASMLLNYQTIDRCCTLRINDGLFGFVVEWTWWDSNTPVEHVSYKYGTYGDGYTLCPFGYTLDNMVAFARRPRTLPVEIKDELEREAEAGDLFLCV
jgi:hypothetical protein